MAVHCMGVFVKCEVVNTASEFWKDFNLLMTFAISLQVIYADMASLVHVPLAAFLLPMTPMVDPALHDNGYIDGTQSCQNERYFGIISFGPYITGQNVKKEFDCLFKLHCSIHSRLHPV